MRFLYMNRRMCGNIKSRSLSVNATFDVGRSFWIAWIRTPHRVYCDPSSDFSSFPPFQKGLPLKAPCYDCPFSLGAKLPCRIENLKFSETANLFHIGFCETLMSFSWWNFSFASANCWPSNYLTIQSKLYLFDIRYFPFCDFPVPIFNKGTRPFKYSSTLGCCFLPIWSNRKHCVYGQPWARLVPLEAPQNLQLCRMVKESRPFLSFGAHDLFEEDCASWSMIGVVGLI